MAVNAAALPKPVSGKRISLRAIEIRWGYLFVSPWIIGFIIFTAGPMLFSLGLSFTDYNILSSKPIQWIGTSNYTGILGLEVRQLDSPTEDAAKVLDRDYTELFRIGNYVLGASDTDFWISMKVTATFALVALPTGIIVSICLALLLNTKVRGVRFFRTLIYSPVVVPSVVTTIIFQQFLNGDIGWLNRGLAALGIVGPNWLTDAQWIIPALVIIGLWTSGGSMLIYLAGLQSIPTELYEAAKVDGANEWTRFRRITLPLLTPVILYDLVLGLIGTFQYFVIPYVLTNGQGTPNKAAFFFNMYLYKAAFPFGEMGYASAMAWILLLLVLALTAFVFKSSGRWVFYQGGGKI